MSTGPSDRNPDSAGEECAFDVFDRVISSAVCEGNHPAQGALNREEVYAQTRRTFDAAEQAAVPCQTVDSTTRLPSDMTTDEASRSRRQPIDSRRNRTSVTTRHRGMRSRVGKPAHLDIRMSSAEFAMIENAARNAGVPTSTYARVLLTERTANGSATDLEARLAAIGRELADQAAHVRDQREAIRELIALLREMMRKPSFSEYRARRAAEGGVLQGGSVVDQLLNLAHEYHRQYRSWPQAKEPHRFGRLPPGMTPEQWPNSPNCHPSVGTSSC